MTNYTDIYGVVQTTSLWDTLPDGAVLRATSLLDGTCVVTYHQDKHYAHEYATAVIHRDGSDLEWGVSGERPWQRITAAERALWAAAAEREALADHEHAVRVYGRFAVALTNLRECCA